MGQKLHGLTVYYRDLPVLALGFQQKIVYVVRVSWLRGQVDFALHRYQGGSDIVVFPSNHLGVRPVAEETYQAPGFLLTMSQDGPNQASQCRADR